ncbi:MAG: hypothetical protein MUE33_09055 [Cytophagaceae bacterium]|jgi:hypothetical protein|nr:hypothetical protein [Cytophagaceae bacterium]
MRRIFEKYIFTLFLLFLFTTGYSNVKKDEYEKWLQDAGVQRGLQIKNATTTNERDSAFFKDYMAEVYQSPVVSTEDKEKIISKIKTLAYKVTATVLPVYPLVHNKTIENEQEITRLAQQYAQTIDPQGVLSHYLVFPCAVSSGTEMVTNVRFITGNVSDQTINTSIQRRLATNKNYTLQGIIKLFYVEGVETSNLLSEWNVLDPTGRVITLNGFTIQVVTAIEKGPILAFLYNQNPSNAGGGEIYTAKFSGSGEFEGYFSGKTKFTQYTIPTYSSEIGVFTIHFALKENDTYSWGAIEVDAIEETSNDYGIAFKYDSDGAYPIGAIPKTSTSLSEIRKTFVWEYVLNYTSTSNPNAASFAATDIQDEDILFAGVNVKKIQCKPQDYDFSKFKYPSSTTYSYSLPKPTSIEQIKKLAELSKRKDIVLLEDNKDVYYYTKDNILVARSLTPFEDPVKYTTKVATTKIVIGYSTSDTTTTSISVPAPLKQSIQQRLNIGERFADFWGSYVAGLKFAGNEYYKAWGELSELLDENVLDLLRIGLSEFKCDSIEWYKANHYTKYSILMVWGYSLPINITSIQPHERAAFAMGVWQTLPDVVKGAMDGLTFLSSSLSTQQWKKGGEFINKLKDNGDLGNEIYSWADKAIDKGIEKIQQADACELAYYEGYIGGTIATAIAVPISIEEHIAGLVVSSGVKLLGISAKTIDGVLQLSKAGRVFMETAQDWAKIWYRNKEIPLSQNQVEELKRLLDEGKIDVEESGLVGKTPEGNEFLERVVNGVGKAGLLSKLSSYANLKTWVNTLDDVVDGSLISKLDGLDATYLTKLETDIASASNGAGLKALIKESPDDLTDIWKVLKDDPKYSFELAKTGGSRWEKWAQGNFFKTVTNAGRDFEEFVSNNLSLLRSKLLSKYPNIDLNNYAIFEQVQIKTGQIANGADEFFVADFVLVKKEVNAITGIEYLNFNNAIVLETKLSSTTALTTPQTNALSKVKTTSNTFDIRTISKESKTNSEFVLGSGTSYKTVKVTDYIKVNSDGIGNTIQDVTSLK